MLKIFQVIKFEVKYQIKGRGKKGVLILLCEDKDVVFIRGFHLFIEKNSKEITTHSHLYFVVY